MRKTISKVVVGFFLIVLVASGLTLGFKIQQASLYSSQRHSTSQQYDDTSKLLKNQVNRDLPNNLNVSSFLVDHSNHLGIGTGSRPPKDIDYKMTGGGLWEKTQLNSAVQNQDIPSDVPILTIYEDSFYNLWIGTFKHGLGEKKSTNSKFIQETTIPSDMTVKVIFEDHISNMLIGSGIGYSDGQGVGERKSGQGNFSKVKFMYAQDKNRPLVEYPNLVVKVIYEDYDQTIFVGMKWFGLGEKTASSDTFHKVRANFADTTEINTVFYDSKKGSLLVGTDNGMGEHKNGSPIEKFSQPSNLKWCYINLITIDSLANIGVGTGEPGFSIFHGNGLFEKKAGSKDYVQNKNLPNNSTINEFYIDHVSHLGVGSSTGLWAFSKNTAHLVSDINLNVVALVDWSTSNATNSNGPHILFGSQGDSGHSNSGGLSRIIGGLSFSNALHGTSNTSRLLIIFLFVLLIIGLLEACFILMLCMLFIKVRREQKLVSNSTSAKQIKLTNKVKIQLPKRLKSLHTGRKFRKNSI